MTMLSLAKMLTYEGEAEMKFKQRVYDESTRAGNWRGRLKTTPRAEPYDRSVDCLTDLTMSVVVSTSPDEAQGSTVLAKLREDGHESVTIPGPDPSQYAVHVWQQPLECHNRSLEQLVLAIKVRS